MQGLDVILSAVLCRGPKLKLLIGAHAILERIERYFIENRIDHFIHSLVAELVLVPHFIELLTQLLPKLHRQICLFH